jgi:hypothetical protein
MPALVQASSLWAPGAPLTPIASITWLPALIGSAFPVYRRPRSEGVRFVPDSPLEEDGFEPSVPGERAVVHGMDSPAQIIKPDRLTWPGSGGSSVPVQS